MISYDPLWETMRRKGATTYTLQVKGGISSSSRFPPTHWMHYAKFWPVSFLML